MNSEAINIATHMAIEPTALQAGWPVKDCFGIALLAISIFLFVFQNRGAMVAARAGPHAIQIR
jgi:hypothetical protein